MELALYTTGYSLLISISLLGMGNMVTNDVLQWVSRRPKIIEGSTIICRLMDDIVSHKVYYPSKATPTKFNFLKVNYIYLYVFLFQFEQEREHVASAVECYIEQYGCSEEEACVELHKQVVDAWKDVNEACLHPIAVPMPILMRTVNFSRVMNVIYSDEDGYTNSNGKTKFIIESLLVNSVPC